MCARVVEWKRMPIWQVVRPEFEFSTYVEICVLIIRSVYDMLNVYCVLL
jgi:hypothetical protein